MAETMIVPIITALTPYVLDRLFGEGYQHIPKHVHSVVDVNDQRIFSPPSIKEMSMYGYGYRYPRARRRVIELEYPEEYARAAVFNKAAAKANPWIKFLRDRKKFQEVGNVLREAAAEYRASPEYRASLTADKEERLARSRESMIRRLEARKKALELAKESLRAKYPSKYATTVPYDEAYEAALEDILKELRKIKPTTE